MPHDGDGKRSKSGAGDNVRPSPIVHARSASPPGYFDGMPGRMLGSTAAKESRSPPPPYPGSFSRDGIRATSTAAALPAVGDQDEMESPVVGLAKAAAGPRLDHDAKEERRAWAQRAGVGRVTRGPASRTTAAPANSEPPVSSRMGRPASQPRGRRTSAATSGSRPTRSSLVGHGSDDRSRPAHRRRGRDGTAIEDRTTAVGTETAFAAPDPPPSRNNETATDMVSRAFERYAKDRDMDRHRDRRADEERIWRRPSSAPFALARQTGGHNHSHHHHRLPKAGSDNEDEIESHESSTASEDDSFYYPSAFHHEQRQRQERREARPEGMLPSKTYRDGPAGNGIAGQATGINSGDEGGGRTRGRSSAWLPSDKRGRSGQRGGTADNKRNRNYGRGSEGEAWEQEDNTAAANISGSERERALRKAFELYDLNSDGFITYLEVRL